MNVVIRLFVCNKGVFSIKKGMIISFVFLLLTACNNESSKRSSEVKEEVINQQNKNSQSLQEETAQTVGFITSISSDMILFSEQKNDKQVTLMFEMKKFDSEITSKLKVGQKVRVTYLLPLKYSSPPTATPIELDIIEE